MAGVTYDGVTKRWGDVVALNSLSIEVKDKEFLVFVGPSGCGKSTSLRILAGLEQASEGKVLIGDRVVNDVLPKDRDVAMVFQSYALYPHMTARENMAFGLRLRKTPKADIDRRVTEAARELGIEHLLERKPRELSGGERQRVAVGRAIVREPAVFLMDEPLSNLDAKLRVEARAMLQRLHQRLQTTFIYVTHDQVEAMTMGSRIAILKGGLLQQIDTPQNLYDHPSNMFVAGFIGSPSMNFFEAKLRRDKGDLYVDTKSFTVKASDKLKAKWSKAPHESVILGIRPEDIHAPDYLPRDITQVKVDAVVDVVERMGSEIYLWLQSASTPYVARVDPRVKAVPGGNFVAVMNAQNMHLFDADSGLAIRNGEG